MPISDFERFRASMDIGSMEWHDGIPYDLDALARLSGTERDEAERLILIRGLADWRDVDALDVLGTRQALEQLMAALQATRLETRVRAAEHLHLRWLVDDDELERIILTSLESATILNGQTMVLRCAAAHPTEAVRRKLLELARAGNDDIRVHAAALSHFLGGRSSSPFDMAFRPFYLRFASGEAHQRHDAYLRLCEDVGFTP